MTTRLGLPQGRPLLLDGAVALVVAALTVDRVLIGWDTTTDIAGSPAWTVPLLLVPAAALLWRRTRPVACVVGATAPFALHAALTGHGAEGLLAVVPVNVALYSLGAYGSWRQLVVGTLATTGLVAVHDLNDPGISSDGQLSVMAYLFWQLVLVATVLLGVAVGAVRRARRSRVTEAEAEARRREAVASERAKIARELHDVVTHNVNVVVMQAMAANGVLDSDPTRVRAPLEAIESSGREALAEMRRMLGVLREEDDALLTPQPGVGDIPRLAESLRGAGLQVSCQVDEAVGELPDGMGMVLFRIAQEALTNAMKHARGAAAEVAVRRTPSAVELEVVNGPGLPEPAQSGAGHGLVGMTERAALFGGRVETGPTVLGGFRVCAMLPLEPA
ncbi:histidine kinase [Nocardioides panaciterrulae]|uniref:histidine kinase n=1 Tax=Nocardioides panaciterrulae TaxID=661492 RepID=A0A7Y9JAG6_9ACTN|nr:signal transduction histidine kinase [Nocardioides panaciterrulae]